MEVEAETSIYHILIKKHFKLSKVYCAKLVCELEMFFFDQFRPFFASLR